MQLMDNCVEQEEISRSAQGLATSQTVKCEKDLLLICTEMVKSLTVPSKL